MTGFIINLPDEKATARLGARLAPLLRAGDVACLSGELGAGKTSLARAVIGALTGELDAASPTFALVIAYEAPDFALWHFDLYRLEAPEEVWELGLEDAFDAGVSLVEWPERIARHIPDDALLIRIDAEGTGRRAWLRGGGDWPARLADAGLSRGPESANKD